MSNIDEKFISVVVPVYNAERFLDRCINSILSQTYQNFELLLIDDFSTDKSYDVCEKFAKKDSRIRLLFNDVNKGVSFTRNKGLEEAKGECVTFIDSDDWVDESYLCDFFRKPILEKSLVIQGIFYEFVNEKRQTLFSYSDLSFDVTGENNGIVENQLFNNGCPVAKLFEIQIIRNQNIKFNELISLNEDHLFVLEYYKFVEHINLVSSMNYHYWFDYFEASLTKKRHGFANLMTASECFIEILPPLVKRYNIIDHEYLCDLYTKCGINQMMTAFINSFLLKDNIKLFKLRYEIIRKQKSFISKYYKPKEIELKISKAVVLNFNWQLALCYFFSLSIYLKMRVKFVGFFKTIINRIAFK